MLMAGGWSEIVKTIDINPISLGKLLCKRTDGEVIAISGTISAEILHQIYRGAKSKRKWRTKQDRMAKSESG